ncbi:MAG TPA: hypothetical protein VJ044_19260, partial [Candidatus Hodarchaeales archaeon]|nr:hypothetical protein [Candidatus Hodarchaeales archaeon]
GPRTHPQRHLNGKRTFCASTEFGIAAMFAFRKTPAADFLMSKFDNTGIVIEFDMSKLTGKDYVMAKDTRALIDEKEVSVIKPKKLRMVAYWKFINNKWDKINIT